MSVRKFAVTMAAVLGMSVAAHAGFGGLGDSLANSAKNAAKDAATGAAVGVVEKSINNRLEGLGCGFSPKGTDATCDLKKVFAELKAGHMLAEKNHAKSVDFNVIATVCGKGDLQAQRSDKIRKTMDALFKGWDSEIKTGGKGDCLDFAVDLN